MKLHTSARFDYTKNPPKLNSLDRKRRFTFCFGKFDLTKFRSGGNSLSKISIWHEFDLVLKFMNVHTALFPLKGRGSIRRTLTLPRQMSARFFYNRNPALISGVYTCTFPVFPLITPDCALGDWLSERVHHHSTINSTRSY